MRTGGLILLALALSVSAPAADTEKGRSVYRSNCAFCHGLNGLGGRGPDLVTREIPEAEIKQVVREGIPGSTMPSFPGFEPDELDSLVAFVKHLRGTGSAPASVGGDATRGRAVYTKLGCAGCHQIGAEGSTYGPDLSRIGNARPVHYLRESIVEPNADIPPQYEGVTVTMPDGKRITGIRVNEDTFSIQLRLPAQQFRSFLKSEAKQVAANRQSLMPAYKQLPAKDLDDLVAYLASLRGAAGPGGLVKQSEGIR